MNLSPIPVAAWSKEWVCCHSLAGIAGSDPVEGMDVCLVFVVCCQVAASAMGRSLVQRSPTEHGVCLSVHDPETPTRRRPWPDRGCCATEINRFTYPKTSVCMSYKTL
jgi:hypothetical protein